MTKVELMEEELRRKFAYESTLLWEKLYAEFIDQLKQAEQDESKQETEETYYMVVSV